MEAGSPGAVIVHIGTKKELTPRRCDTCDNAAFSSYGVYCTMFNENIYNEVEAAADCEEWEPNA